MTLTNDEKGAAVQFPPPLLFLLFIFASFGLDRALPLPRLGEEWAFYPGLLMLLTGLGLVAIAASLFKNAHTHIEPWKPTSSIISTSIYARSRNPIYLAFCLISAGIGLITANLWMILSVAPAAGCVYLLAIRKEETYLEQKFGEEYLAYKRRVRRWL